MAVTTFRPLSEIPDGLEHFDEIADRLRDHRPVLVLDFDGTLAPIETEPTKATLPPENRRVLEVLARHCPVAVLSGRDLRDLRHRVGVSGLWYAGSHGFELVTPEGAAIAMPAGESALPDLDAAERLLTNELGSVLGVLLDRKRFALAVHYRNVSQEAVERVVSTAHRVGDALPGLRTGEGRCVVELLPNINWNKGRALRWLLERLALADVIPVFAGDDYTDEDALREIHHDGIGIVVRSGEHGDRLSWAHYAVDGPRSLSDLLARIASSIAPP